MILNLADYESPSCKTLLATYTQNNYQTNKPQKKKKAYSFHYNLFRKKMYKIKI